MNILRQVAARYKGLGGSRRGLWPGLGVSVGIGVRRFEAAIADAASLVARWGSVDRGKRDTLD